MEDKKFIEVCETSASMREASIKTNIPFTTFKRKAQKLGCYKTNQGGVGINKERAEVGNGTKFYLKDILDGKYPQYQTGKLKARLFKENIKKRECERCGIKKWNDEEISFEMHHINGKSNDHLLENLQILCPNCHSQTDTWRGRNIRK